jgi:hypothetical protein
LWDGRQEDFLLTTGVVLMRSGNLSRRQVIECGLMVAPALALFPSIARAADACADPNDSLRASLHYTEAGTEKDKTCSACGLFTPDGDKTCGTCMIFNGPANVKGHCDSWSAKG